MVANSLYRLHRDSHVGGVGVNEGVFIYPNSAVPVPVNDVATTEVGKVRLTDGLAPDGIFLHVAVARYVHTAAHE